MKCLWLLFIGLLVSVNLLAREGNLTQIKVSGVDPNLETINESLKSISPESKDKGPLGGLSLGNYANRLSNAYGCFSDFIQQAMENRVKVIDLTLQCGNDGAACGKGKVLGEQSKALTENFYGCLDGQMKMGSNAEATSLK